MPSLYCRVPLQSLISSTTRRPSSSSSSAAARVQQWKSVERIFILMLFGLFLLTILGCFLSYYVWELPNFVLAVIIVSFVISLIVCIIVIGVMGQRRRTLRRIRRNTLSDVYTISPMFFPHVPFPPPFSDSLHIPRPTILRSRPLVVNLPQYSEHFGLSSSPPPAIGAPPCYSSLGRPTHVGGRSTISPPPSYEEAPVIPAPMTTSVAIEIDEEIIVEPIGRSSSLSTAMIQVIDCSKEVPQLFAFHRHETSF